MRNYEFENAVIWFSGQGSKINSELLNQAKNHCEFWYLWNRDHFYYNFYLESCDCENGKNPFLNFEITRISFWKLRSDIPYTLTEIVISKQPNVEFMKTDVLYIQMNASFLYNLPLSSIYIK